jgi:urease accessory protein
MLATKPATRTRTSRTDISVAIVDGRLRVDLKAGSPADRPVLRPMLVSTDQRCARIALVPDGALLLAGDHIALGIRVGPSACLDLLEPSGTVAYDMRGGAARWDVDVHLDRDAGLVWRGEPFVVAAGADVRRRTRITLGAGARLALRETLVLGRYAEPAGRIGHRLDIARADGPPVLVEEVSLDEASLPLLTGGRRVLGSVLAHGVDVSGPAGPDRFDLEPVGDAAVTLLRRLDDHAHSAVDAGTWRRVASAVLDAP